MNSFEELTVQMLEALKKSAFLQKTAILPAFSPQKKPFPLRTQTVCLSIKEITVEQGGFGGAVKDGESGPDIGEKCTVDFALEILCPLTRGAGACQELFSQLCSAVFSEEVLPVRAVHLKASHPDYSRENDCFLQQATLRTVFLMTEDESGLPLTDFLVRRT